MKNKGFSLIDLFVICAIIGILSAIVLASLSKARQKNENADQTAQEQSQASCIKQGGVPILTGVDIMIDCKFNPNTTNSNPPEGWTGTKYGELPPCNVSDLPYDMPIETKRTIQDELKGHCI